MNQSSISNDQKQKDHKDLIVFEGQGLSKIFGHGKHQVRAVDGIDFKIPVDTVTSIVGESGSGKTTLSKILLGLSRESEGKVLYRGQALQLKNDRDKKAYWSDVQAVFQDPFSSFNQFYTVEQLLVECLKFKNLPSKGAQAISEMTIACETVNLDFEELRSKHSFELSGGQMQRIMIARIFILKPKVLIADEPTSMIDACSRSMILDMLLKVKEIHQMTILFITHDLGLAYYMSDQILIMQKGQIVEMGTADEVILNPKSTYTKQLLEDVPSLHKSWNL